MYKPPMKTRRSNPDFLNGVPELLILSLLSRRPMYGYQLVQAIHASTNGTLEFGEGCVCPSCTVWKPKGCWTARGRRLRAGAG